jgi:hypothetical protein
VESFQSFLLITKERLQIIFHHYYIHYRNYTDEKVNPLKSKAQA